MENNIARYRRMRKMTQEDLAWYIGQARSTVAHYERGYIDIPSSVLLKIARVLGVEIGMLIKSEREVAP